MNSSGMRLLGFDGVSAAGVCHLRTGIYPDGACLGIQPINLGEENVKGRHWEELVVKVCRHSGFVGDRECSFTTLVALVENQASGLGFDLGIYRNMSLLEKKLMAELLSMGKKGVVRLRCLGGEAFVSLCQM